MARTDTLVNFVTDICNATRTKTGKTEPILLSELDTEIESIQTGGGEPTLQDKSITITENGTTSITADEGYDGLGNVNVTTSISSGSAEITDGSYLFHSNARIDIAPELLAMCKNLSSTYYMFYNANRLDIPIDLSHGELDALTVNNSFYNMFYNASKVPSVKLKSTSNAITTMERLFSDCKNLQSIDIKNLNMENVGTFYYMFYNCQLLTSVDLTGWNTPKLVNMANMFQNCYTLQTIHGLNSLNTSLVTNAAYLFDGCKALTSVNLTGWNTPKLINISNMFGGCDHLETIIGLTDLNTNAITSMASLFGTNVENTDDSIVGTCDVDLAALSFPKLTAGPAYFLRNNKNIRTITLGCFQGKTFKGYTLQYWCSNASSLIEIDMTPIDTTGSTTMTRMFDGCTRLQTITGLNNFDTSSVTGTTGMFAMFRNCKSLTSLDLSSFNTSKITSSTSNNNIRKTTGFAEMFMNCKKLKTLDISNFVINTAMYTLYSMFEGCSSLETIQLPDTLSTANINFIQNMCKDCTSLISFDATKLNLSKIYDYIGTFDNCEKLQNITFQTLDTPISMGTYHENMFRNCKSLTSLDLSWLGRSTVNVKHMFDGCTNLVSIDLSGFGMNNTFGSTEYMFANCTSLKNIIFRHDPDRPVFGSSGSNQSVGPIFYNCSALEVLDCRYVLGNNPGTTYSVRDLFNGCRKLRKLDLRGTIIGTTGSNSSAWANHTNVFKDVGVDNPTPTIVYTDTVAKQGTIIQLAAKNNITWTTDNVIVAGLDEVVDMS